jgi:hypothetical protein
MNWAAFWGVLVLFLWVFGTIGACVEVEARWGTTKANIYVAMPSLSIGLAVIAGLIV